VLGLLGAHTNHFRVGWLCSHFFCSVASLVTFIANNDLSGSIPENLDALLEGLTRCYLGAFLCVFARLLENGCWKLTKNHFDIFMFLFYRMHPRFDGNPKQL
jgi:hypothetical protein